MNWRTNKGRPMAPAIEKRFGAFQVRIYLSEIQGPRGKHLRWRTNYALYAISHVEMQNATRVRWSVDGECWNAEEDLQTTNLIELSESIAATQFFRNAPDASALRMWLLEEGKKLAAEFSTTRGSDER